MGTRESYLLFSLFDVLLGGHVSALSLALLAMNFSSCTFLFTIELLCSILISITFVPLYSSFYVPPFPFLLMYHIRSVSSACGSADVLEALGIDLTLSAKVGHSSCVFSLLLLALSGHQRKARNNSLFKAVRSFSFLIILSAGSLPPFHFLFTFYWL